ncbi:MAG: ABC transporter substrate-binding protein [Candidatus Moranbacteria bacterium]|nr:ABC transporter substrate-binding protein [Candidatus Moranbacteria bacterium]MDD5652299.1 ABC transporter substrate-binding protein [Candidatus Moranbacteria bacterium]MDX9855834.1 ABC transporter substrate-binding protein [Candidatus Moranbacteria bacterium]
MDLKEKLIIALLLFVSLFALFFWAGKIYFSLTEAVPEHGGSYVEGVIGQPMYVNPVLSKTNETDESLVKLIYNGILKYDKNGGLINDLADSYSVSEDGKEYIFDLKKEVRWHDGEKLTSDDIIFTVTLIKDPLFKSPLRNNWQGVRPEKVDDYSIRFILDKPYFGFLENLTFGILPEHIWSNIDSEKFPLTKYNLEPIGTGPYRFSNFHKDSEGNILDYQMESFEQYFLGEPYISSLSLNFYANEQLLIDSYNKKEISGVGNLSPKNSAIENFRKSTSIYELEIPWPFTVFLNKNKSVSLADRGVREALNWATDKDEIIEKNLFGKAKPIDSPFFVGTDEYAQDIEKPGFDTGRSNKILEDGGWALKDGEIREKDGEKLQFSLYVVDSSSYIELAEILKEQWKKIGAEVSIQAFSFSDMQQNHIKPREYDALLVGQDASFNVDPYSFWHSSNKKDPGLNLALFDNEEADKLISEAREENDRNKRIEKYHSFQEIVAEENPAVFLFSPYYLYLVDSKVKGIEEKKINSTKSRFENVDKWYIKTKRVFK